MIEPAPSPAPLSGSGTTSGPMRSPTGTPFTRRRQPAAVIRLDEHADHPAVLDDAGRGADPALEAVADHAGAAADRALLDRPGVRALERREDVLRPDVEAVDVVEEPVPRLADDGQAPVPLAGLRGRDERIAHDPDRVRVRETDRRRQRARVADPLEPGQLAVAVDRVRAGEERLGRRHDHGDARADGLALDQRRVSDCQTRHVGDRVGRAGREAADLDPEVAGARHRPTIALGRH